MVLVVAMRWMGELASHFHYWKKFYDALRTRNVFQISHQYLLSARSVTTVSYTHLDVYKRQLL